jgi:predicted nucleotidyltransferase
MLTQSTIQQIADSRFETLHERISDRFHSEKIILFGSYARGEAHHPSDLDLLNISEVRRLFDNLQKLFSIHDGYFKISF